MMTCTQKSAIRNQSHYSARRSEGNLSSCHLLKIGSQDGKACFYGGDMLLIHRQSESAPALWQGRQEGDPSSLHLLKVGSQDGKACLHWRWYASHTPEINEPAPLFGKEVRRGFLIFSPSRPVPKAGKRITTGDSTGHRVEVSVDLSLLQRLKGKVFSHFTL